MALGSALPQIAIFPAPSQEDAAEPYSPFDSSFTSVKEAPDAYRPLHLTPPPSASGDGAQRQLSPLRPVESVTEGTGLQRERFEALLKASRARQAAVPPKKDTGLLKEIALRSHKNKQVERRALFLAKVQAPPSPSYSRTPATPPDSPAIFHYSLPSPGLSSPLSVFESLDGQESDAQNTGWVEQVDFRPLKPSVRKPPVVQVTKASRPLPSLDQITAHIHNRTVTTAVTSSRLPAFLKAPRRLPTPPGERPRLAASVGRLTMPVRAPEPVKMAQGTLLPPATPTSPLTPKIEVTTVIVPRTTVTSPNELTENNLLSFNNPREARAKTMLSAIRKRQSINSDVGISRALSLADVARATQHVKRKSAPGDILVAGSAVWGAAAITGGF